MDTYSMFFRVPDNDRAGFARGAALVDRWGALPAITPGGDGLPVLRKDNTFEIRCFQTDPFIVNIVRRVLTDHCQFEER